jgi:SAM-dependent methyltransferase
MWRCAACASLFLDPRPDDASISATYRAYYTHSLPEGEQAHGPAGGMLWAVFRGYLRSQFDWQETPAFGPGRWLCALVPPLKLKLDYLARHLFRSEFPAKGVLVDVGCGNGEFLAIAAKMGWRALGVEPDAAAATACRAQGFEVFEGVAEAAPSAWTGAVDVLTSSNCIEHIADPRQFLATAHALLKPGGRLWIATPNPQGLGARLFGRCWRGLEPSRHMCVPSQGQLLKMLAEQGFVGIRLVRRGAHGKTIARESAQVARMESADGFAVPLLSQWLAWPVRVLASGLGTIFTGLAEETVVVAHRAPKDEQ